MAVLAPLVALAAAGVAAVAVDRAHRRVLHSVELVRRDRSSSLTVAVAAARSASESLRRSVDARIPR